MARFPQINQPVKMNYVKKYISVFNEFLGLFSIF